MGTATLPETPEDPSSSTISLVTGDPVAGLELDITIEYDAFGDEGELTHLIHRAVQTTLQAEGLGQAGACEISVRIIDNVASQDLNNRFRGKDKPTNVLSFPGQEPDEIDDAFSFACSGGPPVMFGDIVVAAPVVIDEAKQQNKKTHDHLMHLMVHGVLHLLGHDHIEEQEAELMEATEREILAVFGIANPYRIGEEND
jgi:probable rRNA maturation factor